MLLWHFQSGTLSDIFNQKCGWDPPFQVFQARLHKAKEAVWFVLCQYICECSRLLHRYGLFWEGLHLHFRNVFTINDLVKLSHSPIHLWPFIWSGMSIHLEIMQHLCTNWVYWTKLVGRLDQKWKLLSFHFTSRLLEQSWKKKICLLNSWTHHERKWGWCEARWSCETSS